MRPFITILFIAIASLFSLECVAQDSAKTRILFLMDASASMNNSWEASRKIDDAKQIISDLADSLKTLEDLELGLRVYGHQSMPSAKDCEDSRIEVPFGSANYIDIFKRLASLRPKGITPITYSLESAADDFPKDKSGRHYIILITDGDESCEGDPCETAAKLKSRGIILKSFVIGLGLQDETKEKFKCFDDFYDASDAWTFESLLKSIVNKIVSQTTTQVDIIDIITEPSATDIPLLFYQADSFHPEYAFYHSLNKFNYSDTLIVDTGNYNIQIQTIPPLEVKRFPIQYLKHNTISKKASFTGLAINVKDRKQHLTYDVNSIIRRYHQGEILNVQELGQQVQYINQPYQIEILTKPEILMDNQDPQSNDVNLIEISAPGELVLDKKTQVSGALFHRGKNGLKLIAHLNGKSIERFSLQEGIYTIVYRPKRDKSMSATETEEVEVKSDKVSSVILR